MKNKIRTKIDWLIEKIKKEILPPEEPNIEPRTENFSVGGESIYKGWITRDRRGKLKLHAHLPVRFKVFGEWEQGIINIPPHHFPEINWNNEPVEIEIHIKIKQDDRSNNSTGENV